MTRVLAHAIIIDNELHFTVQQCVLIMLHCCTGFSCCINDATTEDVTSINSDNSRRQLQSSDSTTQSVNLTDDVQVDDSDVLDATWDHTYCSTGHGNIDDVTVDTSDCADLPLRNYSPSPLVMTLVLLKIVNSLLTAQLLLMLLLICYVSILELCFY